MNNSPMPWLMGWVALGLMLPGAGMGQETKPTSTEWHRWYEPAEFESAAGESLGYRFMKPDEIREGERYPLVLFLHGAGERGQDNRAQLIHGLRDFASPQNRQRYPTFLIAPQCPSGRRWVEVPWDAANHELPATPSVSLQACRELIAELITTHPIDRQRIYVTGLSMGGFGTFDAATRWPELFAAAAAVCGGGDDRPEAVARLKQVPMWIAHGDADRVVLPERSRRMVEALKAAGAEPIFVEFPGVGHDSWTATYSDPAFMEWLFAQKKPADPLPK